MEIKKSLRSSTPLSRARSVERRAIFSLLARKEEGGGGARLSMSADLGGAIFKSGRKEKKKRDPAGRGRAPSSFALKKEGGKEDAADRLGRRLGERDDRGTEEEKKVTFLFFGEEEKSGQRGDGTFRHRWRLQPDTALSFLM